jgi:hypothetical protein
MVCTERVSKIAGGFVQVPVASMMACWRACQAAGGPGVGAFRAWLACHEMKARRCLADEDQASTYDFAELAKLTGTSERWSRASVGRLVAAGLLVWSDSVIGFPEPLLKDEEMVVDTISGGRGRLAIPRRMLRFLAGGARPALIATVLGILLRCLSRNRDGWDGRGRVKASWIARVFDIDLSRVKLARADLVNLGWIEPEDDDQWSMNRWGRAYRIDLEWAPPTRSAAEADGRESLPPRPADRPQSLPPCLDQEPLQERIQNQEPARGGPAGACAGGLHTNSAPVGTNPVSTLPAPRLVDIRPEDLKDTARLLDLHRQAVASKLISPSEADQLHFFAAAEHARAIGKGNPCGLFAYLVRGACWRYLTQEDEDRANARIKAFLRGPALAPVASSSSPFPSLAPRHSTLSDDARIVREMRAATIRAGIFRDPFPVIQARDPAWTRERWDRALAELGM